MFNVLLLKSRLWVRGAARIARQPSKLKALGSNPSGPASLQANLYRKLLFPFSFLFLLIKLSNILFQGDNCLFSGGFSLTRVRNNAFRESRETVIEDSEIDRALAKANGIDNKYFRLRALAVLSLLRLSGKRRTEISWIPLETPRPVVSW